MGCNDCRGSFVARGAVPRGVDACAALVRDALLPLYGADHSSGYPDSPGRRYSCRGHIRIEHWPLRDEKRSRWQIATTPKSRFSLAWNLLQVLGRFRSFWPFGRTVCASRLNEINNLGLISVNSGFILTQDSGSAGTPDGRVE